MAGEKSTAELLAAVRELLRVALLICGVILFGYGIFHFMRDWPYAPVVLWICSAFGLQFLGFGMLLWAPASSFTSLTATVTLFISTVLFLPLWIANPLQLGLLVLTAGSITGAGSALIVFRKTRKPQP